VENRRNPPPVTGWGVQTQALGDFLERIIHNLWRKQGEKNTVSRTRIDDF
jgi:hypothetical protein